MINFEYYLLKLQRLVEQHHPHLHQPICLQQPRK